MRSLRTTLLIGLACIFVPLIGAFAAAVYGHARTTAREAMLGRLVTRAKAIANLIEYEEEAGAFELEVPIAALPEYAGPADGRPTAAYFIVHDLYGGVEWLRSPSLGPAPLPAPSPWEGHGRVRHADVAAGPNDVPLTVVTFDCVAGFAEMADEEEGGARVIPRSVSGKLAEMQEEKKRFQIQVALPSAGVDEALARLAWFLALSGGGAVVAALGGGLYLSSRLLRPIRAMAETARTLTPEEPDRRIEPDRVVTEMHSLARTLNSAFDRLGEALAQQKRFIADASHELRTPTAVLLSNAELLLRRHRDREEYRRGLERQRATARRMADLVRDLLTLARADAGHGELSVDDVSLTDIVREVCDESGAMARARGVELEVVGDADVRIAGDAGRLAQLVLNLVSNALEVTGAGGHVRVAVHVEGSHAIVAVMDDGPGVPPEHQSRLFERFYRVRERSSDGSGTGLGLAISSWIAQAHGGTISIESEPGEGATFRVVLPLLHESTEATGMTETNGTIGTNGTVRTDRPGEGARGGDARGTTEAVRGGET